MLRNYQADSDRDRAHVRQLFVEYLEWANSTNVEEFGFSFDVESMVEGDMQELGKFNPPDGRLLLAEVDGQMAGLACMRRIRPDVGEIKRMFVRPEFRGAGIGRALLEGLIAQAREIGYPRVRLDSTRFMKEARALYRSVGLEEIDPYPESEIPAEYHSHWVFMGIKL